jgi:hypothetical protein
MTANFKLDIHGYNRVENALRRLAVELPPVTNRVAYKWAQNTRAVLKSTPYPERNNQRMRWVSERQRRYVMAAIRRGDIQVPYNRTGNLANRWSAAQTPTGAVIRNSAGYAEYVIGDARTGSGQYWMHRNRWWRAREIINREAPKLTKTLKAELQKEWRK